ncbi:uncharacterized protein Z519_05150 [Cladophialophora bantiana CBS 173.52]|uniref:Alpha/beta hydrolase fold-3 domain-containing protein n=1 Tax=Cladophialophora bantiana (strain ATCC 10958 / CBS 173.52 / CDC B-1940 / NIH 8579) TaxID=1442370 RepID=A0A0D2HSH9_CLAB1|nr:uncharacterized protein Z519_05150 [Cladophialophora bantiana CBS 173.52]KIW93835.1 hypothetical protein Z519_05150 [Cladophialophora bantiana CBS 173.52]
MAIKQEGRLGDPNMDLSTDPRMDPNLLKAIAALGLTGNAPDPPVRRSDPHPQQLEYIAAVDQNFNAFFDALPNDLPDDHNRGKVDYRTETIKGVDNNDIILHIYRPAGVERPLPCVIYIHGGGMVIIKTENRACKTWCEDLALTGLVAIAIDFRNGYTKEGLHPYPAGLNDCSTSVAWISAHKKELEITKIVVQGESGGANLSCATALKAKRDGKMSMIDGVYAIVPYISGAYGWDEAKKLEQLPSLVECNGYFLNCQQMDVMAGFYDPTRENETNPLAWPLHASTEDLAGLPPHVVVVDELDPLRDEGKEYLRKLQRASVKAIGRVSLGLTHGADSIMRQAVPEVYKMTVSDVKRFVDSI